MTDIQFTNQNSAEVIAVFPDKIKISVDNLEQFKRTADGEQELTIG